MATKDLSAVTTTLNMHRSYTGVDSFQEYTLACFVMGGADAGLQCVTAAFQV